MTKEYKELLALVARNGAINGENAVEWHEKGLETKSPDEKEHLEKTTQKFRELEDKINNDEELGLEDYVLLYVGSIISREILAKNVNTWTAMINEYDTNLIPRLHEVAKEINPTKREELVEKFFSEEN